MKVQALWYGGPNYAVPYIPGDIEDFRSIKSARQAFENRASFDPMFPCVDSSEMHIYKHFYGENGPDLILKSGPRSGTIVERG
jgi:hypothetical protein